MQGEAPALGKEHFLPLIENLKLASYGMSLQHPQVPTTSRYMYLGTFQTMEDKLTQPPLRRHNVDGDLVQPTFDIVKTVFPMSKVLPFLKVF